MLIGFCGKRHAGKSHAAKLLIAEYGFGLAKFAEAIKGITKDAYLLTDEHVEGKLKELPCVELGGKTPRDAMEWIGEGSREMFGEDVWVRRWFDVHHDEVVSGTRLVFDDVRNNVEASAIRQAGGKVFRIFNNEADAQPTLPSEKDLHKVEFDFALINFKDAEFYANVRRLMDAHTIAPVIRPARQHVSAPLILDEVAFLGEARA